MARLVALILAFATAVSADVLDFLEIKNANDAYVFVNGSVHKRYDLEHPKNFVRAQALATDFYVHTTGERGSVKYDRPKVNGTAGVSVFTIGSRLKGNLATTKGKVIHFKFACHLGGDHTVHVTIPVYEKTAADAKEVKFAFTKSCPDTKISGLDITLGISTFGEAAYAVRNGEATPFYDAEEPRAVIRPDKSRLNLYIQTPKLSKQTYDHGAITAVAADSVVEVSVTGKAAPGGKATKMPTPFMLKFVCSGAGKSMVTVSIDVPNQEQIKFSLIKECTAGIVPGFDITLGSWDSADTATYAVKNGKVANAYNVDKPTAVVREAQFKTSFYLQMSTFDAMELDPPAVKSNSDFCRPTLSGDASTGGWLDDISSTLVINFNCLDSGVAKITVTLPLFVEWDKQTNISFSFEKECRWSNTPGFDVTLGSYAKSSRGTFAVRNGMATSEYSIWEPTAVVREKQFRSIFYLQMSTDESLQIDWPQVTSSEPFCKTKITGQASKGANVGGKGKSVSTLIVTYSCVASGTSIVTVSLPIGTWNEASFAFKKVCQVGAIPGFDITLPFYVPDDRSTYAVKNGRATDAYDAVNHEAIIRAGTTVATFYLQMSTESEKKIKTPEVHSSNAVVSAKLEGTVKTGGVVNGNTAQTIMLMFSCTQPAKSDITVSIPVLPSGDVNFAFKKDCIPNGAHETTEQAVAMAKTPPPKDTGSSFSAVLLYCAFSALIACIMFCGWNKYQQIMNPNCEKLTKQEQADLMAKFDKNEEK